MLDKTNLPCPAGRPLLRRGLYLVLTSPRDGYEVLTEWAVAAALPAVQFRPKTEDARESLRIARAMRAITRGTHTLFIVNDRPDLAVLSGADGVHLGQTDLPPCEARRLVGDAMLIGLSTHNPDQVRSSCDEAEVDYIGFGPLYATTSKATPDPIIGPGRLHGAACLTLRPIVAIGGLTPERIRLLDPCSFHCAAVIRAVADADNPAAVLHTLQSTLENIP